jgi:hypothetical protein
MGKGCIYAHPAESVHSPQVRWTDLGCSGNREIGICFIRRFLSLPSNEWAWSTLQGIFQGKSLYSGIPVILMHERDVRSKFSSFLKSLELS